MAFYVVYILEAHPIDAWVSEDNVKHNISIASEKNLQERCAVAETCATKLAVQFDSLIDDLQNTTEMAYTAWPDRLYVVDREGRIAYKSAPGPFGFKPHGVSNSLTKLLPNIPPFATSPGSQNGPEKPSAASHRLSAGVKKGGRTN